jgi:secreted trypsin-like serine protease
MRKAGFLTALALVGLLATGAVQAITFGENDNGRHPFVGSLVFEFEGEKVQGCSGTQISPRVFLTAGHCLVGLDDPRITGVWVTFDDVIDADADGVVDAGVVLRTGEEHVHPDWGFPGAGGDLADAHDVAVFVLDAPVAMAAYGQLPAAGLVDRVDKRTTRFTTVGYGTVRDDKTKAGQSFQPGTRRKVATQELLSVQDAWANFSMNPATGSGGTCFGDSGGPHFLGAGASETRIVLAVTVTGDRFCRATDKTYRVDTPQARSFLDDFVAVP